MVIPVSIPVSITSPVAIHRRGFFRARVRAPLAAPHRHSNHTRIVTTAVVLASRPVSVTSTTDDAHIAANTLLPRALSRRSSPRITRAADTRQPHRPSSATTVTPHTLRSSTAKAWRMKHSGDVADEIVRETSGLGLLPTCATNPTSIHLLGDSSAHKKRYAGRNFIC